MIENILRHVGGVEHYGIISLCLFVLVFMGVLVWAFTQEKGHLDYMAQAPLDPNPEDLQKGNMSHEQ